LNKPLALNRSGEDAIVLDVQKILLAR
jgi:hypothetical protein